MTIFLVRHASAGSRDDSDPADHDRALDDAGLDQAAKLTDWLRHEEITRILSSPFRRCVQTVQPLADELGLQVELSDWLAETADVDQSWKAVAALADECAVLCSHGDVIPDLVSALHRRGAHLTTDADWRKATVWVLTREHGRIASMAAWPPPEI